MLFYVSFLGLFHCGIFHALSFPNALALILVPRLQDPLVVFIFVVILLGRAKAQAVSRRLLTAETLVRPLVNPFLICGE
jgi:hypothetical protein